MFGSLAVFCLICLFVYFCLRFLCGFGVSFFVCFYSTGGKPENWVFLIFFFFPFCPGFV